MKEAIIGDYVTDGITNTGYTKIQIGATDKNSDKRKEGKKYVSS